MKRSFTILTSLAAVLLLAVNVQGQTCLGDQFGGDPNCTANDNQDFTFSVDNVDVLCNGVTAQVDLTAVFGQGNATTRYDIGVFVATDGGDALNGTCERAYAQSGDPGTSDVDGDTCWDKTSATGVEISFENVIVACQFGPSNPISACVSWGQNTNAVDTDGNDTCDNVDDLIAGSPAKCVCGVVDLGQLPVELVSFSGQVDGSDVSLSWETASETNNAGFGVEHSYRDSEFEEVGFVTGAGTSLDAHNYSFEIADLTAGKHLFRLKQLDFDGTFEYSGEIELTVGVPDRYVLESAYPNPFNPSATINFLVAESAPVTLELYNILGVHAGTLYDDVPEANTTQTVRVDGSNLPSGIYVVRLTGVNFTGSQQIALLK